MHNENDIYRAAINKWGNALQAVMLIEEMSELQKEITKFLRGKTNFDHLAEEMADVEIMLNQAKLMFNNHDLVSQFKTNKLQRLSEAVNND